MNGECVNCSFKMVRIGASVVGQGSYGDDDASEFISLYFHRVCAKKPFELKNTARNSNRIDEKTVFVEKADSCVWFNGGDQTAFLLPTNCQECKQVEFCRDKTFSSCMYFYNNGVSHRLVRDKISEMLYENHRTIEELIHGKSGGKPTSSIVLDKAARKEYRKQDKAAIETEHQEYLKRVWSLGELALELDVTTGTLLSCAIAKKIGKQIDGGWVFVYNDYNELHEIIYNLKEEWDEEEYDDYPNSCGCV